MKIHSNILTRQDFQDAARKAGAGVYLVDFETCGSRSRIRAFKFTLTGNSSHWRNGGTYGANHDDRAATWDEWGMFLAHLFDVDPQAHCGKNSYLSAEHFHWSTSDRFRALTPPYQHARHRWQPTPVVGSSQERGYYESQCTECEALHRYVAYGHTWEAISA